MLLTVKKDSLKDAISVVSLGVSTQLLYTSVILFEVTGKTLTLWSTDKRVVIKVPVGEVESNAEGRFTVEAARISKWLASVTDDNVTLETNDNDVKATCGRAVGHFLSLDPDVFPEVSTRLEQEKIKLFEATPETLINALSFVGPFIPDASNNNRTAENLQVMMLRHNNFMATDSYSLAIYKTLNTIEDNDLEFKITRDDVKRVTSFLSMTADDKVGIFKVVPEGDESSPGLYVIVSDDGSIFAYPESHFSLPVIENIPQDRPSKERGEEVWRLDKKELVQALKALEATASEDDTALTLTANLDKLVLSMRDAKLENFSVVEIPLAREVTDDQQETKFQVNFRLLAKPLNLYKGDDIVFGIQHEGQTRYVKMYEEKEEDGAVRVCIVSMMR